MTINKVLKLIKLDYYVIYHTLRKSIQIFEALIKWKIPIYYKLLKFNIWLIKRPHSSWEEECGDLQMCYLKMWETIN